MPRDDVAARLIAALDQGDDVALARLLSDAVRMVVDTGDDTGGSEQGRASVIPALRTRRMRHPDASLEPVRVNGGPGLVLRRPGGEVVGVLCIGVEPDGSIGDVWLSSAPGKLTRWNRGEPAEG
ncbi:hypothetical protein EDM22_00920 [Agromyces tardus]|uniref:Uncharacterized protein n=1 Tax=Agromyces tardus TaxID=2583849 RepID=A0A3M8AM80_9MICO|nr:hypothetical protein [Agromyces tardus]RNB52301.1 hypothetical protein EDM22_00920 [Agromyces tardus]